jgi:hypothetical protein
MIELDPVGARALHLPHENQSSLCPNANITKTASAIREKETSKLSVHRGMVFPAHGSLHFYSQVILGVAVGATL